LQIGLFEKLRRREPPNRWARRGLTAVAMLWVLLAGFGGCFMLYTWTTDHSAVLYNENILQLCPLLVLMLVLIPKALSGTPRVRQMTVSLAGIALLTSILGLLLKLIPSMYQVNSNIIALSIPANAGLAWAMWKLAANRESGTPIPQSLSESRGNGSKR